MRVDGLTGGCCRTQLRVCSCCSIDEDDGSFPSILTCEGEEVVYRGRLGVARAAALLLYCCYCNILGSFLGKLI
ncbi:hypothetical protein KY285_036993 [Solanum tuberosum]|nr:hypothetical protein KY285_036993 [Solanum tuberosum]